MNSRTKGKYGEREWRDVLRSFGWSARRGQQFSGSPDSPDVICESLPIHWEVKRVESLNIHAAMAQAVSDAGTNKTPVVAHRRNHGEWMVTLLAEDFLKILKGDGVPTKASPAVPNNASLPITPQCQ